MNKEPEQTKYTNLRDELDTKNKSSTNNSVRIQSHPSSKDNTGTLNKERTAVCSLSVLTA